MLGWRTCALLCGGLMINTPAESYVLTTGTETSGDVTDTELLDGVKHVHDDVSGALDLYYQFDIGGDGVPHSVVVIGNIDEDS